jgi:mannose-6-phosphate isomerase
MDPWRRPFILLPRFAERPWGVHDLAPLLSNPTPDRLIGEAWFTSDANETGLGATLGDLARRHPAEILGPTQGDECALLVKLLFTSERLSVQVHPDDEYAARHHGPGARGKTEAWHILSAAPGATIGLGVTAPLTRAQARDAALSGDLARLMDWRPAAAGDTFLVPAGTVHALGPGLTLVEVQEQSDITYRLFDYGRGRDLHLEQGLDVADLGPYTSGTNGQRAATRGRTILTRCRYFTMECRAMDGLLSFAPLASHFHVILVIEGDGRIGGEPFTAGDVYFVPARAEAFAIETTGAKLLITYPGEAPSPSFYVSAP